MPSRLLLFSDAHMRARRGDEAFALTQITDAAIAAGVEAVVAAGDLFDKQTNRAAPVVAFHRELDRLQDAGIAFYFVEGQHDQDDPQWLSGHRHAKWLHKTIAEIGPHVLYGLNFQPFGRLQEELAEVPDHATILVCHQVWSDWMGDIAAPQGDFAQIPGNIKLLHTGDLHQWKLEVHVNAAGGETTVLSTGATTQQKVDEPREHYYALLDDDGKVFRKKLRSRVFWESDVLTSTEDLDTLIDNLEERIAISLQTAASRDLPEEVAKPLLRFQYNARLADTVRRIEKVVGDRTLLAWKEIPPEETELDRKVADVAKGEAVTPIALLSKAIDREDDPAAYELVSRLLQSPDQGQEFAKWRKEYLEGA